MNNNNHYYQKMQNNYNEDNDWNYKDKENSNKNNNECTRICDDDDEYDSCDENNRHHRFDTKKDILTKMLKKCKYTKVIEFDSRICLFYNNDIEFRNNVNKIMKNHNAKLNINLSYNKNNIDTNNLTKVQILNLTSCEGIKNVGNLKNLKKLTINEGVEEFHLLPELDELTFRVRKPLSRKTNGEIKKLKRKNPDIKIEIIYIKDLYGQNYNIMRIIAGMGNLVYSN